MKIPVLRLRDEQGNVVDVPAIRGPKGDPGQGVTPEMEEKILGLEKNTQTLGDTVQELGDVTQELANRMIESEEHPGCYYHMVGEEVEWLNPPLEDSVPYRTTERLNGKVVYAIFQELGALPAFGTKEIYLASGDEVRPSGYLSNVFLTFGSGRLHCGNVMVSNDPAVICRFVIKGTKTIELTTFTDMSGYTTKLYSKYTLD